MTDVPLTLPLSVWLIVMYYFTIFSGAHPLPSLRSAGVIIRVIAVHPHSVHPTPPAPTSSSSPALFCGWLLEVPAEGGKDWRHGRWFWVLGVVVVGCISVELRGLKDLRKSKTYERLSQRGFQKSKSTVAWTAELDTCQKSSQPRYGKNLP